MRHEPCPLVWERSLTCVKSGCHQRKGSDLGAISFLVPLPILATLLVAWSGNKPWYLALYIVTDCAVSRAAAGLMGQTRSGPAGD
jgi:hypothetical protein